MDEITLKLHHMWFRSGKNYLIICPKCDIFNHEDADSVTSEGRIVPVFKCFSCNQTSNIVLVK